MEKQKTKNKKTFWGFRCAWLALARRKAIPRLLARSRDFERPEHVSRSPAETHSWAVVYTRPPCVPRSRERKKRPAAGGEKLDDVQKRCVSYIYVHNVMSISACHLAHTWYSVFLSIYEYLLPGTRYQISMFGKTLAQLAIDLGRAHN